MHDAYLVKRTLSKHDAPFFAPSTKEVNQYEVFPYVFETKNHLSVEDQLRVGFMSFRWCGHSPCVFCVTPNCLFFSYRTMTKPRIMMHAKHNTTQAVKFPDVNPTHLPKGSSGFSMTAGDFTEVYAQQEGEWDVIATCFFIDTANNILEYVRLISHLLPVGGHWINFGELF